MKIGVSLIFFGTLTLWQFSTLFGILMLAAGVGSIGYLAIQEQEERTPARDYSSGGVITYNVSSKRRG